MIDYKQQGSIQDIIDQEYGTFDILWKKDINTFKTISKGDNQEEDPEVNVEEKHVSVSEILTTVDIYVMRKTYFVATFFDVYVWWLSLEIITHDISMPWRTSQNQFWFPQKCDTALLVPFQVMGNILKESVCTAEIHLGFTSSLMESFNQSKRIKIIGLDDPFS